MCRISQQLALVLLVSLASNGCSLIVNSKIDNADDGGIAQPDRGVDGPVIDGPNPDGPARDSQVDDMTINPDLGPPSPIIPCGGGLVQAGMPTVNINGHETGAGTYDGFLEGSEPVVVYRNEVAGRADFAMWNGNSFSALTPPAPGPPPGSKLGRIAATRIDNGDYHLFFSWENTSNGLHDVFHSERTGAAWSIPPTGGIAPPANGEWWIAAASNDNTAKAFISNVQLGDRRVVTATTGTAPTATALCTSTVPALFPQITMGGGGNGQMTYREPNGNAWFVTDTTAAMFCPATVQLAGQHDGPTPILVDAAAGLHLAFADGTELRHAAVLGPGGFPNPAILHSDLAGPEIAMAFSADRSRVFIVARIENGGNPFLALFEGIITATAAPPMVNVSFTEYPLGIDGRPGKLLVDDTDRMHLILEIETGPSQFDLEYFCGEFDAGQAGCGDGRCEGPERACGATACNVDCGPCDASLIAFWPFDEFSNGFTMAIDASGNNHEAFPVGNIVVEAPSAKVGEAYDFAPPPGGGMAVPSAANLNSLTPPLTAMMWVRPFSSGGLATVLSNAETSSGQKGIDIALLPNLALRVRSGGSGQSISTAPLPANQWTHVAVVVGSGLGAPTTIYLNGVNEVAGTLGDLKTSGAELQIGATITGPSTVINPFDGYLDQIKLINDELTQSQIQAEISLAP